MAVDYIRLRSRVREAANVLISHHGCPRDADAIDRLADWRERTGPDANGPDFHRLLIKELQGRAEGVRVCPGSWRYY